MDDVTIPALMLIAANLCVLAILWSQQRAIVRLERRAADLADAVLALPDPPHERPGGGGPPTSAPRAERHRRRPDAGAPTPAGAPRVASLRPAVPRAGMAKPLTGRE